MKEPSACCRTTPPSSRLQSGSDVAATPWAVAPPTMTYLSLCSSSLPELLEKKRLIDLHTNVATAVLDHIKVGRCRRGHADPGGVRKACFHGNSLHAAVICVLRVGNWTFTLNMKRN